nr:ATP-binding cassette subfamily G-like 11-2 [Brachionus rubens]
MKEENGLKDAYFEKSTNGLDVNGLKDYLKSKELTLAWENVNVFYPVVESAVKNSFLTKNESNQIINKQIIKNVSGIARPYEILAILGSSGSGKTTLLNVLNFKNRGSLKVKGDIKINGDYVDSVEKITHMSGYVQQDDLYFGTLKVKEHLLFQAMLRMDKNSPHDLRVKRIEEILNELNLKKCENSWIGSPERGIKGISGGERRRLSFASEIITNPSILFCDEPTSGLDSYMAMSIVDSMKNLAKHGKTIIFTIHQPSSEIFEMFDKICLISEGRLVFLGDRFSACDFFESQGYKSPSNYNPADHFIKTLSILPNEREQCLERVNKLSIAFENSKNYDDIKKEINKNYVSQFDLNECSSNNFLKSKSSICREIKWLFWRHMIDFIRDPLAFRVLFTQTFLMGIIYGMVYLNQKIDQSGIQNINGVLFICILNNSFSSIFAIVNTFPKEIPLFVRENQNGIYRVFSYFVAKSFVEFPVHVLLPLMFTTLFYWMSNLNDDVTKFFICCAITVAVAQAALAYGQFISAVAPKNATGTDLAAPLTVPLIIFCGYFLNNESIPKYFLWLKYLSWFSYANEILIINQWEGVKNITCDTDPTFCFHEGESVIDYLNMKKENYNFNIFMLFYMIVGWRVLGYFALLIRSYRR